MGSSAVGTTPNRNFAAAFAELEASRWLPLALLATGTLSAAVTPHAPLAAFAAMAGVMLNTRKAIGVAGLIWLIDQVAGVGLRGYPIGPLSLTWAVVMAAGTAAVALLASQGTAFARRNWSGHALWSLIALSGGFLLYQGAIVLIHPAVVDGHAMGAEVVGRLLRQQFIWGGGLALAHGLWLQRRHAISTFDQFPREGNEQDG